MTYRKMCRNQNRSVFFPSFSLFLIVSFTLAHLVFPTQTVEFGVYADSGCTVSLTEINWGTLNPGNSKTVSAYVKNLGTDKIALSITTDSWNPPEAVLYLHPSWTYTGQEILSGEVLPINFVLGVDPNIVGITNFSYMYTVTASSVAAPTPTPTPTPSYTLSVTVKDQCNNPLPASVYFNSTVRNCDSSGYVSYTTTQGYVVDVRSEVKVDTEIYGTETKRYTVSQDLSDILTIQRRFLVTFKIAYTDGAKATGTIKTTGKETLSIVVTNGEGKSLLLDGIYNLGFEASPAIDLGSITVSIDKVYTFTLTKPTVEGAPGGLASSSEEPVPVGAEPSQQPTPSGVIWETWLQDVAKLIPAVWQTQIWTVVTNYAGIVFLAVGIVTAYAGSVEDEEWVLRLGIIVLAVGALFLINQFFNFQTLTIRS